MEKVTRLGIGSFCYPFAIGTGKMVPEKPMTAWDMVDRAKELEVKVVQIADNYPLTGLRREALENLSAYARGNGISIEVGMRGLFEENLETYLKTSKILNAKLLRCVIDRDTYRPDLLQIKDILCKYRKRFEKDDLVFGIENHDRFPSSVFKKIMEDNRDERIGIVLDTVNSFACEENSSQVIETLGKYTVNFHVKDYEIKRCNEQMGLRVTGTIAGQGFLKIPEMLKQLRAEAQTDFSSILELWMEPCETAEETVAKEQLWVKESIQYLKNYII